MNLAICSTDLTLVGSTFQREVATTEKVPILILRTKSKSEPDDRRWIGFLTGVNNECK